MDFTNKMKSLSPFPVDLYLKLLCGHLCIAYFPVQDVRKNTSLGLGFISGLKTNRNRFVLNQSNTLKSNYLVKFVIPFLPT